MAWRIPAISFVRLSSGAPLHGAATSLNARMLSSSQRARTHGELEQREHSVPNLKAVLFSAYDGFSDKRIKRLENGRFFEVDGQHPGVIAADVNHIRGFARSTPRSSPMMS